MDEPINHQPFPPDNRLVSNSSQRPEVDSKDLVTARKVQKADREKLRRDRLNEQFVELGTTLDPERPKNDKATILADTIQMLKDLTAQVEKLKAEHATLNEESRELTHEKNDLREEKVSLKSEIENLNVQYQQRVMASYPWAAMDHSGVMTPTPYPYPMPMQIPPGQIPMHPSMQPYPFFGNQNPGITPNPCSTFVPYLVPNNTPEYQSTQFVAPPVHPCSRSRVSSKQDSRSKSSGKRKSERSEPSDDVATDLELKIPGSIGDQASSPGQRKSKKLARKENLFTEGSSSSKTSSSHSVQDSSSNSIIDDTKADD